MFLVLAWVDRPLAKNGFLKLHIKLNGTGQGKMDRLCRVVDQWVRPVQQTPTHHLFIV